MTFLRWLASLLGFGRKPTPPPPDPVALWRQSAEALYREELHREIDPEGWRYFQQQAQKGWTIEDFRVWIRASAEWGEVHSPKPEPPKIELPPLDADGRVFRLPNGNIWRYQGATAFALLKRELDGDHCEPFLDWLQGLGVNVVRFLCRCVWLELNPAVYGNRLFDSLGALLERLEGRGLRGEVVALADCRTSDSTHIVPPEYTITDEEAAAFLRRVADVVWAYPAHLLEDGNEWRFNGWNPAALPQTIGGVLRSRGCGGMDDAPVRGGDYGTFHSGRGSEFPRKMGKQPGEWSYGCGIQPEGGALGVPVVDDEPEKPNANSDPWDFYCGHASASLLCAGSTLHSDALKYCQVPTGRERECLEAAARAWTDVPLGTVLGDYTRGGLDSSPLEHSDAEALRTFATIRGTRADAVIIRPTAAHRIVPRNGWRVVSVKNNRVVELAR